MGDLPRSRREIEVSLVGTKRSYGRSDFLKKSWKIVKKEGDLGHWSGGEKILLCTVSAPPRGPAQQQDFRICTATLVPSEGDCSEPWVWSSL